MPRKSNKYEQILEGAADVFIDVGFEKATIQEIAIRSEVGKGTIYEYFSSKEELFFQFVKDSISYVFAEILEVVYSASSFDELLMNLKESTNQLLAGHQKKLELLFHDFNYASKSLHQWVMEQGIDLTEKTANVLETLMDNGEVRHVQSFVAASMILDIIRISFFFRMTNSPEKIEEIIDAKIDILKNGLAEKG